VSKPTPPLQLGFEICRVGQNRIYTPYMTVYIVISLPKIPYIHRIYMVLANPRNMVQHMARSFIKCVSDHCFLKPRLLWPTPPLQLALPLSLIITLRSHSYSLTPTLHSTS